MQSFCPWPKSRNWGFSKNSIWNLPSLSLLSLSLLVVRMETCFRSLPTWVISFSIPFPFLSFSLSLFHFPTASCCGKELRKKRRRTMLLPSCKFSSCHYKRETTQIDTYPPFSRSLLLLLYIANERRPLCLRTRIPRKGTLTGTALTAEPLFAKRVFFFLFFEINTYTHTLTRTHTNDRPNERTTHPTAIFSFKDTS